MRARLPADDEAAAAREPLVHAAVRLAIVAWLLAVEPAALALWLDRALPRLASLGAAAWSLVALRVALIAAGIAIGRRLLAARDATIWGGVIAWAAGAMAVVLAGRLWPLPFTDRAPSEARRDAAIAIAGYLVIAGLAWRRRRDAATPADSS
jgi:hypothetical protein